LSGPSDQAIETKACWITRSGVLDVGFEANQEVATTVSLWPRVVFAAVDPEQSLKRAKLHTLDSTIGLESGSRLRTCARASANLESPTTLSEAG